jgi:hypothetical protein
MILAGAIMAQIARTHAPLTLRFALLASMIDLAAQSVYLGSFPTTIASQDGDMA